MTTADRLTADTPRPRPDCYPAHCAPDAPCPRHAVAPARNTAEIYGRAMGSVSSTYTVSRRDPATGELVVESVETWARP